MTPGQRLGPYEILAAIGAGGMGEVYKARDTRLNRDVAIKVLPASFSTDADRLRRFQLEAQSAGALNHPNILVVYDIGSQDQAPYLVSELLEGETLREKLRQGKLPIARAIDYAKQIAAGLAAAHGKGITHRDIKPENLFVTKNGHVKILDFGLAKVTLSPEKRDDNMSTETRATNPGAVMGTAAYMSPEQVRAQPVDHRSDIFSLGCVLYEMVSGKRAFRGDTSVETMNAILKEDPPELGTVDTALPPALDRIVRHCLEKNPDDRFQSARDLAFDLDSLSLTSGRSPAVTAAPRRTNWLPWAVALALLAAGLAGGYWAGTRLEPRQQPKFQRLTFRHGMVRSARFAPDANTIVYTADWENAGTKTFSVRLDSPEFHPTVLENATLLVVSSSGELAVLLNPRTVAFQTQGTLARVPFSGGAPREVLESVQVAEWSPKGELAVVRDGDKDNQLEFPIGKVLFHTAGFISHMRFSPNGDQIAFLQHPQKNGDNGQVMVVDFSGHTKTLSQGWGSLWGLAWMPRTNEVCFTGTRGGSKRELHAVTLGGVERTILAQTGNLTLEDIARDGRVLLNSATQQMKLHFIAADDAGVKQPRKAHDLSWLDWSLVSDLSPDGKAIVFFESGEGAGVQTVAYYRRTDGSPAVKLGTGENPKISPDGKSVALVGMNYDEVAILPIGPGEAKHFPQPGISVNSVFWLPNGKDVLFVGNEAGHGLRTYRMPIATGKAQPVTPEGLSANSVVVTPDGSGFVVTSAKRETVLYRLDGGEPKLCAGIQPDERAYGFTSDGSVLYVMSRGALPAHVYRVNWQTGKRELWRDILPADSAGVNDISGVRLTPDGKSYAYSYVQELSELHLVEGLR
jgi:Tol biopolymer transport system component